MLTVKCCFKDYLRLGEKSEFKFSIRGQGVHNQEYRNQ